ncbi:MAG: Tad domain-containing protein [Bradymonadaceae bacterium]
MNGLLRKFHENEQGAVLILCLAAFLVLMLMAWTLFDTGKSAKDKLRLQAGADTAAYSQAAIKARSMNMLAYTNISKRSIWGIHSLYPSYLRASHEWIKVTINSNCEDCVASGDSTSQECRNCNLGMQERDRWINRVCQSPPGGETAICQSANPTTWGMFRTLSGTDYGASLNLIENDTRVSADSDFPMPVQLIEEFGAVPTSGPRNSLFENYHAQDMRALDNYQRYIVGMTPWWGWMEQLVRSTRSGASMSVSWPVPAGVMPGFVYTITDIIHDFFNMVSSAGGGSSLFGSGFANNYSLYTDHLPVYPARMGTMRETLREIVNGAPGAIGQCILDAVLGGTCDWQSTFHPFLIEHLVNSVIFAIKSEGFVGGDNVFPNRISEFIQLHYRGVVQRFDSHGLRYTEQSFANVHDGDRIMAEPFLLQRYPDAARWQVHTSNIILAYHQRFDRFDNEGDRQKFEILGDYRGTSQKELQFRAHFHGAAEIGVSGGPGGLLAQETTYGASGYWSMSRGEIFFEDDANRPPDLWSPSWSARLRPVSLGDEFNEGQYEINQVYHDVMPLMAMAVLMGVTNVSALSSAIYDLAYMERVSNAMGPSTIGGLSR